MQYYFIQEILVSDWIISAAHAQNRLFLMLKSRYFTKADYVNIQPDLD